MNFGELIAKGGAIFLRKKLSAVQAVYDDAPAGEKAAFQSSVSGYSDTRKLAKWFKSGIAGKRIAWCGDSTTWQFSASSITYVGNAWAPKAMAPDLFAAGVLQYNRGFNGATLQALTTNSPQLNSDGVDCSMGAVAALGYDAYVICLGTNDCRQDAAIAGSTYGSAAQLAKAATLRGHLAQWYSAIKAVNPNAVIAWRMPGAHKLAAASYLLNGVTGQNAMDVYRLTYVGDPAYSLPPLDALHPDTLVYDTLVNHYSTKAIVSAAPSGAQYPIDTDNFHQANGYNLILPRIMSLFSKPFADSITCAADAARLSAREMAIARGSYSPRTVAEVTLSGEYVQVASGKIGVNIANQTALNINPTYVGGPASGVGSGAALAYGATSGAYGSAYPPAVHVGDILVAEPIDGSAPYIERIANPPSDLNGADLRWYSGNTLNGVYPVAAIAQGSPFRIFRHIKNGSEATERYFAAAAASGTTKYLSLKNYYRGSVVSATTNTLTLRAIPYADAGTGDFASHTLTTSDVLCLSGKWGSTGYIPAIPLTSATFAAGTDPGTRVITMTGFDFTGYCVPQAVIFSAT